MIKKRNGGPSVFENLKKKGKGAPLNFRKNAKKD